MRVRRTAGDAPVPDGGFTLIEVVVAVVLLAVIMPSVSLFFVSSIKTSATLQRRDAATQLADEAMELVRAVPAVVPGATVSSLVKGRTRAAVEAQWLAAPAGLDTTTPAWDDSATSSSVPVVPLQVTKTVGQQRYTIDTFIGRCAQRAGDTVCSNTVSGGASFHRIVVRVAWSPGPGVQCSGRPCEFLLTTVVNGDNEPVFNTSVDAVRPVANPDAVSVVTGQPVSVAVLPNDTGTFAVNPVTILGTGPANGALSGTPASGTFTYTSSAGFSGIDTFQYRLTDSAGLSSDPTTVTVTVTLPPAPVAAADSLTAVRGSATTVAVLGNDTGTLTGNPVTIVTNPSQGTLSGTPASGTFTYTSQSGYTGTDTFSYRLTDRFGRTSNTVTVTVNVIPPAPVAYPFTLCVVRNTPSTAGVRLAPLIGNWTDGGTFTVTGPDPAVWNAPSTPTPSNGDVTVTSKSPPPAVNTDWAMPYTFTDTYGRSTSATVTIAVRTSC